MNEERLKRLIVAARQRELERTYPEVGNLRAAVELILSFPVRKALELIYQFPLTSGTAIASFSIVDKEAAISKPKKQPFEREARKGLHLGITGIDVPPETGFFFETEDDFLIKFDNLRQAIGKQS